MNDVVKRQLASYRTGGDAQWWPRAQQLEREGRSLDAEREVDRCAGYHGRLLATALLYEMRMCRAAEAGDERAALKAAHEFDAWLGHYAKADGPDAEVRQAVAEDARLRIKEVTGWTPGDRDPGPPPMTHDDPTQMPWWIK